MVRHPQKRIIKSPLRYPGGKGAFYPYFSELMKQNGLHGGKYFEPFAGGAGVALGLLSAEIASEVVLNDADYHIYCFWASVLKENQRFIEKIRNVELSIEEWQNQKKIYSEPELYTEFEVGFSLFYLNRCNRSGILAGAGPIGGYKQQGKWRLDARFNKEELISRITQIGMLKNRMFIENMDAVDFLTRHLTNGPDIENVFVYIDPPYVSAGNRLYLNFYSDEDHRKLAEFLLGQAGLKWVVTYDDDTYIRELYHACQKWLFYLGYSLQSKQKGEELLIAPESLQLPNRDNITTNRWNIIEKIV